MPTKMRQPLLGALLWVCAASLPILCLPIGAAAQGTRGALAGVVLNGQGMPVAAAQVFYQSADGTSPHILRTDARGRFRSALLRAGLYDIRAEAKGRWSEWRHNVEVPGAGEESLTLRLVRRSAPTR